MTRPKKRKLEVAEATAEAGPEVDFDTGDTGVQQPGLNASGQAAAAQDPTDGPGQKKWRAALETFEKASEQAALVRRIATDHEKKEKLAERLYEAKMRRLEAGDKLGRRKKPFGAARRSYEALVELLQVQHKSVWMQCRAAEAERDAARAEMRVMELE